MRYNFNKCSQMIFLSVLEAMRYLWQENKYVALFLICINNLFLKNTNQLWVRPLRYIINYNLFSLHWLTLVEAILNPVPNYLRSANKSWSFHTWQMSNTQLERIINSKSTFSEKQIQFEKKVYLSMICPAGMSGFIQ